MKASFFITLFKLSQIDEICRFSLSLQWHDVSNTVWWQDFPRLNTPNCSSLFTRLSVEEINIDSKCDFAAQLAGFMASLVADVPSQASWIVELIKYDFSGAAGYLVASVPGIHSQRSPVYESKNLLVVSSCYSGCVQYLILCECATFNGYKQSQSSYYTI